MTSSDTRYITSCAHYPRHIKCLLLLVTRVIVKLGLFALLRLDSYSSKRPNPTDSKNRIK